MRVQTIFAVILVLAASLFGVCPACEHASLTDLPAQPVSAPAHAHECCERLTPQSGAANTAPESQPPATPQECSHESANLALQAAVQDTLAAPALLSAAIPMATLAMPDFILMEGVRTMRATSNPSPPTPLDLPIRI